MTQSTRVFLETSKCGIWSLQKSGPLKSVFVSRRYITSGLHKAATDHHDFAKNDSSYKNLST
jgi:hypothetical protein